MTRLEQYQEVKAKVKAIELQIITLETKALNYADQNNYALFELTTWDIEKLQKKIYALEHLDCMYIHPVYRPHRTSYSY